MITKTERTELRSVVRQQFRVLRHEVLQRQVEMEAEVEHRLVDRYRAEDEHRSTIEWKVREIVKEADRAIEDLLKANDVTDGLEQPFTVRFGHFVAGPRLEWTKDDRVQLRRALQAGIAVQVQDALLRLDRQEADLLRTLAVGALESDEAKAFLTTIPTVSELVPKGRLAELEAEFDSGART